MAGEPLITVVGNLVADPEARISQAGKPWATFRIASTPRERDRQSGQWTDGEPLWLGCRVFGDYADHVAQSLTKGMRVIVMGRLTQRTFTDNQGQQRTALDLDVEEVGPSLRFASVEVMRSPQQGYQPPQGQQQWTQPQPPQQQAPPQQQTPLQSENPWQADQPGMFGGGFDDEQPF